MYESMKEPTGVRGEPGDPGPRGFACEGYPEIEKYPHGWTSNSHAGIRGPWGAACEIELLEHLIYWLDRCKEPVLHDPAGNAYCGVESNVVNQTLDLLRRYQRLLTQPLGEQIPNFF